ncbi:MAG: hypothetical protein HKN42_04520 [Granulosicoccus sp.]|nr:hypothetical protein [Granulosicoccus sp.]
MGSSRLSAFTVIRRTSLLLVMTVSVSACSALGLKAPWHTEPAPDYQLIAENLVNSLSQFPHLNPHLATVQVVKPHSSFSRQVETELDNRGYKLERVDGQEGLNQVKPEIRHVATEAGEKRLYVVSIGQVSVERAFDVIADKTVPASEQIIRGTKERRVSLNDDIFEAPASEYTTVAFKPYQGPQIADVLAAPDTKSRSTNWWSRGRQSVVKKNVYETLTSNYQDVFAGYEDVEQSILIFPNDSLRLGNVNKEIIERFVADMNPATDILSVIGCSHGNTEINNGNSLLALGRANRVKEAFLFSGLQHDQILDEGCWAPQTFDEVMPQRGVVLTLKRQKKS